MIQVKLIETSPILVYPDGRMTTEGAALYTGLSAKTLAMMRCQGMGPKFIKRGRVFYFKEDIDAWLNEGGRLSSTSQHSTKHAMAA